MAELIRYLSRDDVRRLLPNSQEQLRLASAAFAALAGGEAQLPPKPSVSPRKGSFLHAMPAYLRGHDIAALKWIGASDRNRSLGLPYLSGLIVLNDPETSRPTAILEAGELTAARTAAASGVCVTKFAVPHWTRVAILGFGVQARAHARLFLEMNPKASIVVWSREEPDFGSSSPLAFSADIEEAVTGADIIVSALPFGVRPRPSIPESIADRPVLLLPLDYDASMSIKLLNLMDMFVVDDFGQFEYYRQKGHFTDWRAPDAAIGEMLKDEAHSSKTMCCNLGVAVLDAVFAAAIVDQALRLGIGMELPV